MMIEEVLRLSLYMKWKEKYSDISKYNFACLSLILVWDQERERERERARDWRKKRSKGIHNHGYRISLDAKTKIMINLINFFLLKFCDHHRQLISGNKIYATRSCHHQIFPFLFIFLSSFVLAVVSFDLNLIFHENLNIWKCPQSFRHSHDKYVCLLLCVCVWQKRLVPF